MSVLVKNDRVRTRPPLDHRDHVRKYGRSRTHGGRCGDDDDGAERHTGN